MNKIYSLFLINLFIIFFIANAFPGQQVQDNKQKETTPQRAAEGQTKWMVSQLRLDTSLFSLIYNINYKYQVKSDSVRMTDIISSDKNELYLVLSQKKNNEFKQILTPKAYNDYLDLLESVKARARTSRNNP